MTRNATLNLEGFDPDVLEAARDVARRAGVPVETWIASIVEPSALVASPSAIPSSVHVPAPEKPRQAEPVDSPHPIPPAVESPASPPGMNAALAEMMRRLDGIDQRIASETKPSPNIEAQPVAGLEESRIASAGTGSPPGDAMAERLAAIERRMNELGEQIATPRPLGRRGRPAVTEVREAVSEIRQRQRELAGGVVASAPVVAPEPRSDAAVESVAIAELQTETLRLRESIGSLASGRDVGALEKAMHALAADVQKVQAPSDLAAIAAPIEAIRVQVERLAEDVAENVHARVAADVERLAAKMDGVAPGFAEQDVLAGLFRELDEIRRLIGSLPGLERIQSLAVGLQSISNQISQLHEGMPGETTGLAELRPLLEEIRLGLRSRSDAGIGEQIKKMSVKLDALRGSGETVSYTDSDAILHRIDALAETVERVSINPVGDLIGRLEDLGATLRRPAMPDENLASIHGMLHELTVKLDRIGTSEGPRDEGLDALEQQVLALAGRIDTRDADPALAGLQRTMTDLLDQVSALRAEAPIEAAVERAARNAVAETMGSAAETGEVALLRASLADLRAHQVASEQRMQSTLTGVYAALERLVGRVGPTDAEIAAPATPRPGKDAPDTETTETLAAAARPVRRPAEMRAGRPASAGPDLPLEPGAGRPGRERSADRLGADETQSAGDSDIKTSFIAAARRAAQAAQAEASGQSAISAAQAQRDNTQASDPRGRLARFRSGIDRRRKPLLLGLAAVVLLLGALQALTTKKTADTDQLAGEPVAAVSTPQGGPAGVAAKTTQGAVNADGVAAASKPQDGQGTATAIPDPQTTQSLGDNRASPESSAPKPASAIGPGAARPPLPRVASMATLSSELGVVPATLSKLRQAALEGDTAAAYDLASRASEGRGMVRNPVLAGKIYEQVAASGFAPAQYKLGNLYEKGIGVTRDLAQAKLWYGRAADLGNARAMHNLAVIHAENPAAAGKPDFATASGWFKRAAEFGLRDSQYNLAVLYARGMGVQQDLVQSYLWFSAAAAQGDEDAGKKRDDVAAKLEPKDLAAARAQAEAFKAKVPEPSANAVPAPAVTENTMSLLGAPPPTTAIPPGRRT
ncbi:SEL1-like repeat protein [Methylobacterium sp. Leaf117]|uniref:SEL1-like repeat protein n=1 Tax=Methylobacterium sp. Leaf117 TaxID=1736260 RepID=UPI000B20A1C6|nr:SEL1-like repeat protein [Methylobacterium sp. Leaf117]